MKPTSWLQPLTITTTLVVAFTGCGGGDPPTSPSPAGLVQLVIQGPDSVAPGGSARFTATGRYGDGSSRDVTAQAIWRSSDTSVLTLAPNGEATAVSRGEVGVIAGLEGRGATKTGVLVVPPGTFKLSGVVRGGASFLRGAEVTVVSGEGTGLTTTSAEDGRYSLYGVAGDIDVRFTSEGYEETIRHVLASGNRVLDVQLPLLGPHEPAAGTYTLTITAADTCAALPADVRVRTYTAVVTQQAELLSVGLAGAEFFGGHAARFSGIAHSNRLTFHLAPAWGGDYSNYVPEVYELLPSPPNHQLAITGDVVATGSGDGYSGTLKGNIQLMTRLAPTHTCSSADHRFVLTR